jgi:predicted nucleic acid-binding protein
LLFILDSNEFIFALNSVESASRKLLDSLCAGTSTHRIRIPRTVFEEVKRNLSAELLREFILLLTTAEIPVAEDELVSFELGLKYERLGFKPADAFIAAYAEWTGAAALVTENRHFLSRHQHLPFKILNAESCLRLIGHSSLT